MQCWSTPTHDATISLQPWHVVYAQGWGRIIESCNGWVGRVLKAHPVPPPAMGRAAPHQLRLPRAPSHLALSACRDGAPTASLGSAALSEESPPQIKPKSPLSPSTTAPACPIADSLTVLLFLSEEQLLPKTAAQRTSKGSAPQPAARRPPPPRRKALSVSRRAAPLPGHRGGQFSPPRPPGCAGWCRGAGPGGRRAGLGFRPAGRA